MEKHKLRYHSISAKTNENIESMFCSIVDLINETNAHRKKKFQNNKDE